MEYGESMVSVKIPNTKIPTPTSHLPLLLQGIMNLAMRSLCRLIIVTLMLCIVFSGAPITHARGEILGIHILNTSEVDRASQLLENGDDKDKFVTVPITLADTNKPAEWQKFFDDCHRLKIRPLVRFATVFENGAWKEPTRQDVMTISKFLSALEWRRTELTVILFNEPNHAKEWGGMIKPTAFASISGFASRWLKTEAKTYTILPAAMDLAADGHNGTMEAFAYWREALKEDPNLFDHFDGWNSHSYPNPAFAAPPNRTGKNSLRGYETELAFVRQYSDKTFPVYITETGWNQDVLSDQRLQAYFRQAFEKIWAKDTRIVAVTPFLLQGAPGTFAPFSFLDKNGKPTAAYTIYQDLLEKN